MKYFFEGDLGQVHPLPFLNQLTLRGGSAAAPTKAAPVSPMSARQIAFQVPFGAVLPPASSAMLCDDGRDHGLDHVAGRRAGGHRRLLRPAESPRTRPPRRCSGRSCCAGARRSARSRAGCTARARRPPRRRPGRPAASSTAGTAPSWSFTGSPRSLSWVANSVRRPDLGGAALVIHLMSRLRNSVRSRLLLSPTPPGPGGRCRARW